MLKMNKIHLYDKILSPVVTEKSTNLSQLNKVTFKVPNKSTKSTVKKLGNLFLFCQQLAR